MQRSIRIFDCWVVTAGALPGDTDGGADGTTLDCDGAIVDLDDRPLGE